MPISIIIPAHNEARVIRRTLEALTRGAAPGELEVIVVCNGCTDDTAVVVRAFSRGTMVGGEVRLIETEVPSKTNALNLGDTVARYFPRFYVDADVVLPYTVLEALASRLEAGDVLAVAPRFRMALETCSWAVRAFYDINGRVPSSREGIGGSGVYGLSSEGRSRFKTFPNLTADDGFVRVQFTPTERATVEQYYSMVFAPRNLHELIRIKTRSHLGIAELRSCYPALWANKGSGNGRALLRLALIPWLWPRLAMYGYVKVVARIRAKNRWAKKQLTWERDETSRSSSCSKATS